MKKKNALRIGGGLLFALVGFGIAYANWEKTPQKTVIPMHAEFKVDDIIIQQAVGVPNAGGFYVKGCDAETAVSILTKLGYKARTGAISVSFPMTHGPCMTVWNPPFDDLRINRFGEVKVRWTEQYEKETEVGRIRHQKNMQEFANLLFYH